MNQPLDSCLPWEAVSLDHCPQQSTGVKICKILREARRKSAVTKGEEPSVVGISVKAPGTQKQLGSALRILNRLFTIPVLDKFPSPGLVRVIQETQAAECLSSQL